MINNDQSIGKGTLYIDNGTNKNLIFKISFGKEDENTINYSDEEIVQVNSNENKRYNIHKGNIRISYDSIITKYKIDEGGDWILNPYRKNRYSYLTVVYGGYNSKGNSERTYTDELFHIDVDYLFQDPPTFISIKRGSSAIRTALVRVKK